MTRWQDLLRKSWRLDSIPVLIALVVGIVALVTPAFGNVTVGRALQLIMIVLVGIVLSLGLDRIAKFADMSQKLGSIASALDRMEHPTADGVLKPRHAIGSLLFDSGDAKEILAIGITLKNVGEAAGFLEKLLARGSNLRLLIWKFDEAMAAATAPSLDGSVNILQKNREAAIAHFEQLAERKRAEGYPGSIEVRELPSLPRVTMLAADAHEAWGRMQVEMLPYAVPAEYRPSFRLARECSTGPWYDVFLEAAENAWKSAKRIDLSVE